MKVGFTPISLENYVKLHLKANPDANRKEVTAALKESLRAYKEGTRCNNCGNPIWVIGSAIAGVNRCFTCITGESVPDEDYEIDEAF